MTSPTAATRSQMAVRPFRSGLGGRGFYPGWLGGGDRGVRRSRLQVEGSEQCSRLCVAECQQRLSLTRWRSPAYENKRLSACHAGVD